jgi:hypothetical protein
MLTCDADDVPLRHWGDKGIRTWCDRFLTLSVFTCSDGSDRSGPLITATPPLLRAPPHGQRAAAAVINCGATSSVRP